MVSHKAQTGISYYAELSRGEPAPALSPSNPVSRETDGPSISAIPYATVMRSSPGLGR